MATLSATCEWCKRTARTGKFLRRQHAQTEALHADAPQVPHAAKEEEEDIEEHRAAARQSRAPPVPPGAEEQRSDAPGCVALS